MTESLNQTRCRLCYYWIVNNNIEKHCYMWEEFMDACRQFKYDENLYEKNRPEWQKKLKDFK